MVALLILRPHWLSVTISSVNFRKAIEKDAVKDLPCGEQERDHTVFSTNTSVSFPEDSDDIFTAFGSDVIYFYQKSHAAQINPDSSP